MKTKTVKVALDSFGSFLGRAKGCLTVRDKEGRIKKYPLFENEIAEIRIRSGNVVSAGALATCAFWGIDTVILTRHGNPVATLKSFSDDTHVETRICQYEALKNGKGMDVAKQFLLAKIRGENELLRKYGLHLIDYYHFSQAIRELEGKDMRIVRNSLMSYEGKCSAQYFNQVFQLFSESIRPEKRKTYKAYDGLNNILNLAYNVLFWKVQIALSKARLEPYLGFLHVVQFGTPSLVCDFMEIYRYLVDDFVIGYARTEKLSERDFVLETEDYGGRKGKRQYLKYNKATELSDKLNKFFESKVSIPRIKRGQKQEIETLISEEAMLFAMYLRNERKTWTPRLVSLSLSR